MSPSPLAACPGAVENLRFCPWCGQLAQKDLNECPTCGRRMGTAERPRSEPGEDPPRRPSPPLLGLHGAAERRGARGPAAGPASRTRCPRATPDITPTDGHEAPKKAAVQTTSHEHDVDQNDEHDREGTSTGERRHRRSGQRTQQKKPRAKSAQRAGAPARKKKKKKAPSSESSKGGETSEPDRRPRALPSDPRGPA